MLPDQFVCLVAICPKKCTIDVQDPVLGVGDADALVRALQRVCQKAVASLALAEFAYAVAQVAGQQPARQGADKDNALHIEYHNVRGGAAMHLPALGYELHFLHTHRGDGR